MAPIPKSICRNFDDLYYNDTLIKLFSELTCLRVVDIESKSLSSYPNGQIPKEIKKLMYLRYLNLSRNQIIKLSETLCELYNLQTRYWLM